ncbi:MAG: hypothetical protein KME45_26740 [Stenomitos rutilans HA7619-LM2]|jgi:hypothetical protein|nr:hypothetical protein [Stenomitos rutilans HA7619-LM2]
MVNPNSSKYSQFSQNAYRATRPPLTQEQQERLDAARKTYEVVYDMDDHLLPNRQLYQKTLGFAEDKIVERHPEKVISRDMDGAIAKHMLHHQRDPEGVAQTLATHSPFVANLTPEQQQKYGSELTEEMKKKVEQEQNQRPERSLQESHTPKTASLDARYRDVGREIATQDAQARHGAQAQNMAHYQERER